MYPTVRAEMARRKITLKDLADDPEIKCTTSTMSFKLNGKAPLTFAEAVRIKEILGTELTLEELFRTEAAVKEA